MADSPPVTLTKYYLNKFEENQFDEVGFLDQENVIIGETYDWTHMKDEDFPRLEMLIWKKVGIGEDDNVSRSEHVIFQVGAYTFRDKINFRKDDYFQIFNWGAEIERLVFQANVDRVLGNMPCPGFLRVEAYPDMDIEGSIDQYIAECKFQFSILLTKANNG